MKKLTRKELKEMVGGLIKLTNYDDAAGGGSQGYMCCNKAGCSACVTPAEPRCVAGAWAVPC
ncbi:hypothetical protein ELOC111193_17760 [Elizabethkingia occulta]|uniref:Bacteriocin n=1 Tax=Elizabethkingia occulta TaxID=1867263 RepID=A0A1T3MXG4_9FLAO|nr:hypothetical protein [Elizabethkingia occulta]OPC69030.1 hypothetical protein BAZ10_00375 [Elizabethkingia occulta]